MKKKIAKIILLGLALTSSYLLGTTQSKTVTKQNDDPNGESYKDIISKAELPHLTDLEENKKERNDTYEKR